MRQLARLLLTILVMVQEDCCHVKLSSCGYRSVEGFDMRSGGSLFLWLQFEDDSNTALTMPPVGPASNSYLLYNFGKRIFLSVLHFLLLIHGGCNDTFLTRFYEDNMKRI